MAYEWRLMKVWPGVTLSEVPNPADGVGYREAKDHWQRDLVSAECLVRVIRPPAEVLLRVMLNQWHWAIWMAQHHPDKVVRDQMAVAAEEYRAWLANQLEKRRRECQN